MPAVRPSHVALCCLLLCALTRPAAAASVSVCEDPAPGAARRTELYGPEGRLLALAVTDETPPADCLAMELPVPAAAVRWFTLSDIPPGAAARQIALQGFFDDDEARVSEVIHAQAEVADERGFLPFNTDIQPYLQPRAFGLEERAVPDGRRLDCAAGERVAGVTLRSDLLWEQLPGMQLEIAASGSGEFQLAIADAEREAKEQPLSLGAMKLQGSRDAFHYTLPGDTQRWTSLVILCPPGTAFLTIHSLELVPQEHATTKGRATWLWEPQLWRESSETAWQIARQENLAKFYVTVPLASGDVEEPARLAAFIGEAQARGIAVWAVAGDRGDVLPEQLPPLLARADAYRRFNAAHPDTGLAGFQLDIEPYLLPGIGLAPDYWRERYVATIAAVHARLAGELPLDLVMPVWWGLHPAWGARLLAALDLPGLSLTVMNYRTSVDSLRAGAMPFFVWGQANAHAVTMALEQGTVNVNAGNGRDETRIDFAAAGGAGELWLLELGGMTALLLLDRAYEGLPGQAYARTGERVIGMGNVSFAGAPDDLQAIAATLEAEWSAWDAFAGLAIHGLDRAAAEAR